MSPNTTADLDGSHIEDLSDPLCFLSPELAFQQMIARYVSVGTLSVFVWDILNNIINDYKLLSKHRIRPPTVVYFISRLCCLGFVVSATVFQTAPIHTCTGISNNLLFICAMMSTSLLFFFRTRAVFHKNPWAVAFFAGLWLVAVVGCLTPFIGIGPATVGHGKKIYCIGGKFKHFIAAAAILPLINDTLAFLAITWRLSNNSYAHRTLKDGIRVLIFGDYLSVFSRAMLHDGQAYYLTTIAANLVAVIMLFTLSIPDNLRSIFMVPNVILMNIMACRVFRNLRLGFFKKTEVSTSFISNELNFACHAATQLPLWREGSEGTVSMEAGDETLNTVGTATTQKVEHAHECAA